MNLQEIEKLFNSFNDKQILIIGDVMVDSYMWGKVNRISPEAPVPVMQCTKQEKRLGGAANVALNIKSLGAIPVLCSVVGDDSNGNVIFDKLKMRKMTDIGIITDPERPTTVKTRIISQGQHIVRVDEEIDSNLSTETEKRFIEHILQILSNQTINAVIFEDYDKGAITEKVIESVVSHCNTNNIPTLVDPKKRNFSLYKGVILFKPNFKELVEGLKIEVNKKDISAIFEASKTMLSGLGIRNIMVTLSELGVFICNENEYSHQPAHHREIADVSGAGDTVIATASLCLSSDLTNEKIAAITNLAGGLVCEKTGVVPIEKQLLLEETIKYFERL